MPCAAGADTFLHPTDPSNKAAKAYCLTTVTGTPSVSDCTKAVAQLQANQSAVCRVINNTIHSSHVTYQVYSDTSIYDVALGSSGRCQVILGGNLGASLPCATIADYATKLISTCGTSNASTGGLYYPSGVVFDFDGVAPRSPDSGGPPISPFIALSEITVN